VNAERNHVTVSQPDVSRRFEPALSQELRYSDPHAVPGLTHSDTCRDILFRFGCRRAADLKGAFAFGRLYFFCRLLSFFLQALRRYRRAILTDQADDVALMPQEFDRIGFVCAYAFNHLAALIEFA